MKGEKSTETSVGVEANLVWEAYRGLELGRIVDEVLGDVLGKVEVIEGDGGVGSKVKLTFPPGTPGAGYMIETFTKMDDANRVKETETTEGGYIALGFNLLRVRLEIIEKDAESSVIRSTVEYELDDEKAELAAHVDVKPLEIMAKGVGNYLKDKQSAA